MKYSEFKKEAKNGLACSVCLFEGEDAFFRENGLKIALDLYVTDPSLNYAHFDGDAFDKAELLSAISSYPFFDEKRIIAINEFYPKADFVKELKTACKNSATSILCVLNSKPCEALKKIEGILVVDCNKADQNLVAKWVSSKFASENIAIEQSAASLLAEHCRCDMKRVEIETEKLICYARKGGTVTEKDVQDLVNRDTEYKIYELTDYIGKRNFDKAFAVITDMLGKGETSQRIIIAVYNYMRRLLHVAISDKSVAELAKLLGIKEFAVKKAKEQAAYFKTRALKQAVDVLADADYKIKSGKVDSTEAMWKIVFGIMTGNLE